MKFVQHYSGSSGNLYTVESDDGHRLIIDPGVTWKKVRKALDYDLSGIVAALLSHEHKDHSKAVEDILAAGIDVYSSAGTFEALGLTGIRRTKPIADKTLIRLGAFEVLSFTTNHDAAEPMGFVVRDSIAGEYLLFATDTSHITQRFKLPFSIIAIECSYDKNILQHRVDTGDINETLAKRLLTSHMEKQTTTKYLTEFCDLSRCRELHLLHLSRDNIDAGQARREIENRFFIKTVIRGSGTNADEV